MRLLKLQDNAELSLVEHQGSNTPPYAIFSHTWGLIDQEVTYQDMKHGTGLDKSGWRKIRFCKAQAKLDGLQYFWMDTCCIDKSSSSELTEAINSMFRWYEEASRCYVYLSDVPTSGFTKDSQDRLHPTFLQSFRRSRWFTRVWTLQEILAPILVEFFSAEGEKLGDKDVLMHELHKITKIPVQVLQGRHLSQFSIGERFSWAATRTTKREEDSAYSLLGIFDVHMPLIYGEGRVKALERLQRCITEQSVHVPLAEGASPEAVFTTCIANRKTFIFFLFLSVLLSGKAFGVCVSQTREPAYDPNRDKLNGDEGFWALLSQ